MNIVSTTIMLTTLHGVTRNNNSKLKPIPNHTAHARSICTTKDQAEAKGIPEYSCYDQVKSSSYPAKHGLHSIFYGCVVACYVPPGKAILRQVQ